MPMEPVDTLMMFKPATVDDVFGTANISFRPAISAPKSPTDRKSSVLGAECKMSAPKSPTTPMPITRTRHFSISETFGSPLSSFNWGFGSGGSSCDAAAAARRRERTMSVADSDSLRDLLRKSIN